MKYLHLIWAALFRRKGRTFLTLVSIITAFLLFGLLDAVRVGFDQAGQSANGAQRLQTGAELPEAGAKIGQTFRRGGAAVLQVGRRRILCQCRGRHHQRKQKGSNAHQTPTAGVTTVTARRLRAKHASLEHASSGRSRP